MKKFNKISFELCMCFLITCILLTSAPKYVSALTETQTLDSKIDEYIAQHEDTIAALATIVIQNNEILVHRTTGYANIEQGIKAGNDTVFEWGSCSKILIWVSVMQLVEDELIDLNTDIREYLPEDFQYPVSFGEPITMMHLMNHSAGFDDSYTDLMIYNPTEMVTLRQALEQADVKQQFQPGDVVAYSNYGAALAAYIVEVVSGMDYREFVKENIFTPLGMSHTSIDPQQKDNPWVKEQRDKIQGYTMDKKLIYPSLYVIPIYPAGSAIGTAGDFARLLTALLSENGDSLFKDKETIKLMFEPTAYYPGTNIPRMAHGLFYLPAQTHVYGHGGNTMAFSSSLYIDRENELGVLAMTNQWNERNFCLGIPELIFGRLEHITSEENLENSSLWEGIYQPARMSYHGFSKLFGLLHRSTAKQQGKHELIVDNFSYIQHNPGIYVTKDDFSIYSLDVYSTHPTFGKILSSTYNDLIQIPLWRHGLELCLIVAGVIAILFSLFYILIRMIRGIGILKKEQNKSSLPTIIQNVLNLIATINVGWMSKKALSMTTYNSLRINFVINILYLVMTITLCIYSIFRRKTFQFSKKQKVIFTMTIICSLILCVNLLYWEFYH